MVENKELKTVIGGGNFETSKNKNTKRIEWLDISRGLAFLMVIYSHLSYKDDQIMQFFSPVFLTTFFFVSGYLFKSGCSFSKVFEQRTRTLLWPFLSLGTLMIVMQHLLTLKANAVPWVDGFKGLLFQNGTNEILWFVGALYVYSIIFYWVERWSGKYLLLVSFLLFVANWMYGFLELPGCPWHVTSAGYACAYMGAGKVYKQHEDAIDSKLNKWILVVFAVAYLLFIGLTGDTCSFSGSKYLIDSLILTLVGLVIIIAISKQLQNKPRNKWLLFIGANTLFYFAFHGKVYSVLEAVAGKVFVIANLNHTILIDDITGFVIVFLDAAILIPFAMLTNRYAPWLLGKGFKLWKVK